MTSRRVCLFVSVRDGIVSLQQRSTLFTSDNFVQFVDVERFLFVLGNCHAIETVNCTFVFVATVE